MPNQDIADTVSAPRSNSVSGAGSALMIAKNMDENGISYEINHPIVLVKHYSIWEVEPELESIRKELNVKQGQIVRLQREKVIIRNRIRTL